uniref:Phosphoesterase n=1 Tax=uncultured Thiotrichaceae bacterium TaxID=298394 RepID=A0A6S6UKN9_9GAMM|nr:MAG: Unknown protein [uncultured Thiotrichaceae bacterium]
MKKTELNSAPQPNGDEQLESYIGNFHKSLPHNQYGEVDSDAYEHFQSICERLDDGEDVDFESVALGTPDAAAFTNPLAGAASETLGLSAKQVEMPPAPGILSADSAAEMVELYWMALLRDVPLAEFTGHDQHPKVKEAVKDIEHAFKAALSKDSVPGALELGLDLPQKAVVPEKYEQGAHADFTLDISPQTLFRCGLPDEQYGPLISQFLLRDVPYGVQRISTKQVPYVRNKDFLTRYEDWLLAQDQGTDRFGRDYGNCNNYEDQVYGREQYYPADGTTRHVSTLRDLARFVNRDALHQAYFNAALFLDGVGAPLDDGNPYAENKVYKREHGFATLGGPDLLTLVSEVASRALKVVWRQKWMVHRRCRPEVYGGLLQMQLEGPPKQATKDYGLGDVVTGSAALEQVYDKYRSYFLPMAFSAGSPNHPAYGAGHATVAGACITILKAWFKEEAPLHSSLPPQNMPSKEPWALSGLETQGLLQPGQHLGDEYFDAPSTYNGHDAHLMTIGGELNKLASNIAMGRSMGGVHWRSDNTRSLRLGEQLACEILCKRAKEYAEKPVSFSFRSFDGELVKIDSDSICRS